MRNLAGLARSSCGSRGCRGSRAVTSRLAWSSRASHAMTSSLGTLPLRIAHRYITEICSQSCLVARTRVPADRNQCRHRWKPVSAQAGTRRRGVASSARFWLRHARGLESRAVVVAIAQILPLKEEVDFAEVWPVHRISPPALEHQVVDLPRAVVGLWQEHLKQNAPIISQSQFTQ